jgi:hypothetical protein
VKASTRELLPFVRDAMGRMRGLARRPTGSTPRPGIEAVERIAMAYVYPWRSCTVEGPGRASELQHPNRHPLRRAAAEQELAGGLAH